MDALLAALPFTLTDEQRAAADEILADMAAPRVMNRLLLGDVGTGSPSPPYGTDTGGGGRDHATAPSTRRSSGPCSTPRT